MDSQAAGPDSTLVLAGAAVALAATFVFYNLRAFSYWRSRGVPGPLPWPIFGTNIYYLLDNKIDVDFRWRKQYGHTYGIYEGYYPLLRTTDNELIKEIFVKNFNSFTDRNKRFIFGPEFNNWLLWSTGATWSNQRPLVSPMFSSAKMRSMFVAMSDCVDRFLANVSARLTVKGKQARAALSLDRQDTSSMTLDVIASCFFGLKLDTYEAAQDEFLREAFKIGLVERWWFFLWSLVPRPLARLLAMNVFRASRMEYFARLTQQIINERRRSGAKRADVVQAFIDAKLPEAYEQVFSRDDDKEAHYNDQIGADKLELQQRQQTESAKLFRSFSDAEIVGQMNFMMVAGFETTSTVINLSLFELAHRPEIQEKLRAELKDKFDCESDAQLAQLDLAKVNHSDFLDLKLLDAFVSETLRLYSPVLDHNRRVTAREGVVLKPKGLKPLYMPYKMPISTPGFVLQRDPDYFERPDEFDLERFMPENRNKIKPATFMPFGLGPRYCVGMRFALMEIKLAIVKIVARCTVAPNSESQAYPPKFLPNPILLQPEESAFKLLPRVARAA